MPISQARMLCLINAALDYQQALDTFNQAVYNASQRATKETALDELKTLGLMANLVGQLARPTDSPVAIAVEFQHFKAFGARNRAEAVRQARRRGRLANPPPLPAEFTKRGTPRDSTPQSIQPANHQQGHSIHDAVEAELARHQTPAFAHDPRVTAEDEARFAAQRAEDAARDRAFASHFVPAGLSPEDQAEIDAAVARELELEERLAKPPAKGE